MTPTKSDLSIIDVISLVIRHKTWVIILTFLGAVAGFLIGYIQQPIYRADTLLSVVEDKNTSGGLAGLARQVGGLAGAVNIGATGSDKNVAIAVLRSRAFVVKFIRERGIEKVLFSDLLAPDGETWAQEKRGAPTDSDVFELFTKQIFSVREDSNTGLITVSIEWHDSQVATDWANEIVREINSQLRTRARTQAESSVDYLQSESGRISNVHTQRAIYNLIEQQINEIMLANVTEEYAFEVIDPATASDPDDYVKPRKVFLLASGLMAGFLLAMALTVGREFWKLQRTAARVEQ